MIKIFVVATLLPVVVLLSGIGAVFWAVADTLNFLADSLYDALSWLTRWKDTL